MEAGSAFDLAFFHEVFADDLLAENCVDFLSVFLSRVVGGADAGRPAGERIAALFGPLAGFAEGEWKRAGEENFDRAMGAYLCCELKDLVRSHAGQVEPDETYSLDMWQAVCCLLCDDELRGLFAARVAEAEDALAVGYTRRQWLNDEYDAYGEGAVDPVNFVRGEVWDALQATPVANYSVSLVYDRDTGCYFKPLNKIYLVRTDDGVRVRVALRSATRGVALYPDGRKESQNDALFSALWNNPPQHYECNSVSKKHKDDAA